jgi:hypothetical protein
MRKAQETFQDRWYTEQYNLFIFSDTNRFKIRTTVLPTFITQTLGRYIYDIVVLCDDDGSDKIESANTMIQCLKDTFNSRQFHYWTVLSISDSLSFQVIFDKDPLFLINVQIVFVPMSLEKLIVQKSLEKFSRQFSAPEKRAIQNGTDIHEAFDMCAKKIGLTKAGLIIKSVEEGWFENNEWFNELVVSLSRTASSL